MMAFMAAMVSKKNDIIVRRHAFTHTPDTAHRIGSAVQVLFAHPAIVMADFIRITQIQEHQVWSIRANVADGSVCREIIRMFILMQVDHLRPRQVSRPLKITKLLPRIEECTALILGICPLKDSVHGTHRFRIMIRQHTVTLRCHAVEQGHMAGQCY